MSEDEQDIVRLGEREALVFPPAGDPMERKGWAAYFSDAVDQAGSQVFLRFGLHSNLGWDSVNPAEKTPLTIRETLVRGSAGGGAVTAALVRQLPFARLEVAANRRLDRLPRPDRDDYPFLNFDLNTRAPSWTAERWARRPADGHRRRGPSLKLRVPGERRKPDQFYEQVAERFLWLTERGHRPAAELAEANGVPVTTVHRWVKEARRRGILPPARRGDGPPMEGQE